MKQALIVPIVVRNQQLTQGLAALQATTYVFQQVAVNRPGLRGIVVTSTL